MNAREIELNFPPVPTAERQAELDQQRAEMAQQGAQHASLTELWDRAHGITDAEAARLAGARTTCEICNADPCTCEVSEADYEDGEPECCSNCGKPLEDFSDIGCGYCDQRSPEWGILP